VSIGRADKATIVPDRPIEHLLFMGSSGIETRVA
jgi:hypothetical protein